jgi:DNA-binding transcriptional ArsR family regulator
MSVSDLAHPFEMTLAAIVQHLQVLEHSGVVRTEKIGRVRTCRLDSHGLGLAERWLSARRAKAGLRARRRRGPKSGTTLPTRTLCPSAASSSRTRLDQELRKAT